ncbi:V-type ATP synthase subunit F [Aminivibrio sp.]
MPGKSANRAMAAVGEYETVLPFQAVGVKPFMVKGENPASVDEILLTLAREKYAVVFVQEIFYIASTAFIDELNREYETSLYPSQSKGVIGYGLESIRSSVERAVGMDIFPRNDDYGNSGGDTEWPLKR